MSKVVMVMVCDQCGAWQDAWYGVANNDLGWRCDICQRENSGQDSRAHALADADFRLYELWLQGFDTFRPGSYPYPLVDVRPFLEPML